VHRLVQRLTKALLGLTATGAASNARLEVDRAEASVAILDAQLGRVSHPSPPRAA
jgi:hypothetical protein